MNVRMVLQGLAPAVHHRDDADLGAEMTRIGGDRAQRLGRGAEKNGVNRRLILECDCGDLGRYGSSLPRVPAKVASPVHVCRSPQVSRI